jgi:hypothetical protein
MKAVIAYKQKSTVEVDLLHEIGGVGVHRSIIGKAATEYDIFTVAHVNSGCSLVGAIESLEVAIACASWIAQAATEAGYPFWDLLTDMMEERSDRRTRLVAIVNQAREEFLPDDDEEDDDEEDDES